MQTMPREEKPRTTPLGKRLAAIRKRLGLSQEQAAAKVFVTRNAWNQWEKGRREPSKQSMSLIELLAKGKI